MSVTFLLYPASESIAMPRLDFLSRRGFLVGGVAASLVSPLWGDTSESLIRSITKETLWKNRDGKSLTWFHPRACVIPGSAGSSRVLMTMQEISGSDYFGQVHWTASDDLGKTWSEPEPIPAFDRFDVPEHGGLKVGTCDVVPEYHPQTKTTLALGHCVFYRGNRFSRNDQLARYPVYSVRDEKGHWSDLQKLEWDDPRGGSIYSNNCGQRVVDENGEIVMSFTFGPKPTNRMVAGVRSEFDGKTLRIKEAGPPLKLNVKRGLLEPSVTFYRDRYYMTIRAEDGNGYVSSSEDGLNYLPQTPWKWDNGEPIGMSTTQQHWLTHSDGLFLVYTRKDEHNANVIRWRSPLFVSQVDPDKRVLIKDTERVVLPLVGDGVNDPDGVALMGNFHVVNASPEQSWVTVGEWLPRKGANGDVLLGRILWEKRNTLV